MFADKDDIPYSCEPFRLTQRGDAKEQKQCNFFLSRLQVTLDALPHRGSCERETNESLGFVNLCLASSKFMFTTSFETLDGPFSPARFYTDFSLRHTFFCGTLHEWSLKNKRKKQMLSPIFLWCFQWDFCQWDVNKNHSYYFINKIEAHFSSQNRVIFRLNSEARFALANSLVTKRHKNLCDTFVATRFYNSKI